MRLTHIILIILVAGFISQTVYYYPNLPEVMASHYNAIGEPDSFMAKQSFIIVGSIILLVIVSLFLILPLLMERLPNSLLNIPNKDHWLSGERRKSSFLTIKNFFEFFAIALLILFITINQLVFRANLTKQNISGTTMWLILGTFLVFVIIWLISFVKRFKVKI